MIWPSTSFGAVATDATPRKPSITFNKGMDSAMKVSNHKLINDDGSPVTFIPTRNHSQGISPIYLIIHYTAGGTLDGAASWFQKPEAEASAHVIIGRDAEVVQMVPFNRRAWHAGDSKWGKLTNLNRYAIGIELVNHGRLRKRSDGAWVSWAGNVVPGNEVSIVTHKHESSESGWHEYTDAQLAKALEVGTALHGAFHFTDVLGHDDVSPRRKADPGPLFPMSSFRSRVIGR